MLNWIMSKIDLMRDKFGPLTIRSYTDIVKERSFGDIDNFRANVLNMNIDDVDKGIQLLDYMEIDSEVHTRAFMTIQDIKSKYNQMKFSESCGGFYNMNDIYAQYRNMSGQAGYNPYAQNQYGQQSGDGNQYGSYFGGWNTKEFR